MNTEDFVTYEQALALKKLGFDEKCLFAYNENVTLIPHHYTCDGTVYTTDLYCSSNKHYYKDKDFCDAPTLAHAQKWLIKEKKYYVNPDADISDVWLWEIVNLRNSNLICMWNQPNQHNHYNSYEKALSAGITECLKMLKNN